MTKEQLTRAYTIIDGKNAKISQLEKERDELKARVEELEHGTVTLSWTPDQFERLVEKVVMLFMRTKDKNPIEYGLVCSCDDDIYKFKCTTKDKGDE